MARALADGCLTVAEFDERVASAWVAKTRGDLLRLVEDLPSDRPASVPPVAPRRVVHPVLRAFTSVWLTAGILSIVVWVVLGVMTGGLAAAWWLWVVGPGGAALATSWYVCDHRR